MKKPMRKSPIYMMLLIIGIIALLSYSSWIDSQERTSKTQAIVLKAMPFTTVLNVCAGLLAFLFGLIIYAIKMNEDAELGKYYAKHPNDKRRKIL